MDSEYRHHRRLPTNSSLGASENYHLSQEIQNNLRNGELILVSFFSEKYGIEKNHQYEIINFGQNENGEFVVLSNPWGINSAFDLIWHTPPDFSSSKMLLDYDPKQIEIDKGIIVLPFQKFKEIVDLLDITENVMDVIGNSKAPKKTESNVVLG